MAAWYENEDHLLSLAAGLHHRVIPTKYAYTGSGAEKIERFGYDYPDEYLDGRAADEVTGLVGFLSAAALPKQICDIGPSNGIHTVQFLDHYDSVASCGRYLGLDISEKLLSVAEARLRARQSRDYRLELCDIEQERAQVAFDWRRDEPMLFCLFGGTLGNFQDPLSALVNIRESSLPGDVLALGLFSGSSGQSVEELIAYYSSPAILDMVTEPLRMIGIADDVMESRIHVEEQSVICSVRLLAPVACLGSSLAAEDVIRCFISRRYTVESVNSLLYGAGWKLLGTRESAEHHYLLAIAERAAINVDGQQG